MGQRDVIGMTQIMAVHLVATQRDGTVEEGEVTKFEGINFANGGIWKNP